MEVQGLDERFCRNKRQKVSDLDHRRDRDQDYLRDRDLDHYRDRDRDHYRDRDRDRDHTEIEIVIVIPIEIAIIVIAIEIAIIVIAIEITNMDAERPFFPRIGRVVLSCRLPTMDSAEPACACVLSPIIYALD
jgi:hypothetical protein